MLLSNQLIYLKKLKKLNINSNYLFWFDDKDIKKYIKSKFNNINQLKNYFQKINKKKDTIFFGIFLKNNNKHIGNIKFDKINKKKQKAFLSIMIGDKKERGKGYASQAIDIGTKYLHKKFGINFFYLEIKSDNKIAINFYKTSGFRFFKKNKNNLLLKKNISLLNLSKFSLGSAQFGAKYGINSKKKPSFKTVKKIIHLARNLGIKNIDTAFGYGNSELILGRIGIRDFKITTKLPYIKKVDLSSIKKKIQKCLIRLRIRSLYALLLHDDENIKTNFNKTIIILKKLKKIGLIKNIGVSVTNFNYLKKVLSNKNVDIVQIPYNLMDQRIKNDIFIKKIRQNKIKIQIRSIFLQGLLFKNSNIIKKMFPNNLTFLNKYSDLFKFNVKQKLSHLLNFAYQNKISNQILIGIDNENQLKKIAKIKIYKNKIKPKTSIYFQNKNEALINPSKWRFVD